MSKNQQRERFMEEAIAEARKGDTARTRPNPRVGAVIVEDGAIVARGHFERDGGTHAERTALANLGRPPLEGAALYVTLEPCSTHGRTGACTEAIISAKLGEVVVGALDPTLAHRGEGLRILSDAGIAVVSGILRQRCEDINPDYKGRTTTSKAR